MRFLDRIAFGPQLLHDLLHVHGVPQQHAVGEQRQAPGRFGLGCLLLAADNAFAAKPQPSAQRMQFFALVELGVDALAQGLTLQVAQNEAGLDELAVGLQHVGQVVLPGIGL